MKFLIFSLFVFSSLHFFAQKVINALPINENINIDGMLNEDVWKNATYISDFTQIRPIPGKQSSKQTKVALLYSSDAIYFSVVCYDHPDSISQVLSLRDDYNPNLDVFGIFLDTYNDNQNGFYFGVTSKGVQLDAKIISLDFNDQLFLSSEFSRSTDVDQQHNCHLAFFFKYFDERRIESCRYIPINRAHFIAHIVFTHFAECHSFSFERRMISTRKYLLGQTTRFDLNQFNFLQQFVCVHCIGLQLLK